MVVVGGMMSPAPAQYLLVYRSGIVFPSPNANCVKISYELKLLRKVIRNFIYGNVMDMHCLHCDH